MNVVIAVHHFPPHYTSGAELRAYRTASRLQARGHDVHVICVEDIGAQDSDPLDFEDSVYGGVAVRRLSFDLAAAPDLILALLEPAASSGRRQTITALAMIIGPATWQSISPRGWEREFGLQTAGSLFSLAGQRLAMAIWL